MTREFLRGLDLGGGVKLPKEVEDAIMAEHGKDVNGLKGQITTLTTERDAWQGRAEKAEAIVEKLPKDQDPAKLVEALNDAQTALTTAKTEYDSKIAERDFNDALRMALEEVKFTSEAAKRDVASQIKAAGLKVQDGAILGLNDMLAKIKEKDASAFAVADPAGAGDEDAPGKGKAKSDTGKPSGGQQKAQPGGGARFTAKLGAEEGPKTKADIMAVPDRKARRALIAQNMHLFTGKENNNG